MSNVNKAANTLFKGIETAQDLEELVLRLTLEVLCGKSISEVCDEVIEQLAKVDKAFCQDNFNPDEF